MSVRYFSLLTIIIALGVFAVLSLTRPLFSAEAIFVVTPKNSKAVMSVEHIAQSVLSLTQWSNEHGSVHFKRADKSSAISLRATSTNPSVAEKLRDGTVQALLRSASMYYNVKTDIDIRVKTKKTARRTFSFMYVFVSVVIGFVVSFMIVALYAVTKDTARRRLHRAPKWVEHAHIQTMANDKEEEVYEEMSKKKQSMNFVYTEAAQHDDDAMTDGAKRPVYRKGDTVENHASDHHVLKFNVKKDSEIEEKSPDVFEKYSVDKTIKKQAPTLLTSASTSKRSSAPSNLPIVAVTDDTNDREENVQEKKATKTKASEPTDDELKERLNKLLRGEL